MKKMDREMQVITDKGTLKLAKRISNADIMLSAIIANGLTTGDAVENNECGQKCDGKDKGATKAPGLKNWFVCAHKSLSFNPIIAQV